MSTVSKRSACLLPCGDPRPYGSRDSPNILQKHAQEKQACCAINELPPDHLVNHEENRREQHARIHVDVKVSEHQIKQAVTKLWHVAKVYTLLRPDEEKTCVHLAPDYDTLDFASQTKLSPSKLSLI